MLTWKTIVQVVLHSRTCTQWHMAQCQKNCINGECWEGINRQTEDKPRELQTTPGRKGCKVMLAIYTIHWLPTMCQHKLPTTIMTSLTLSNFWYLISHLWVKCLQLAHACPTMSCILNHLLYSVLRTISHFYFHKYNQSYGAFSVMTRDHQIIVIVIVSWCLHDLF